MCLHSNYYTFLQLKCQLLSIINKNISTSLKNVKVDYAWRLLGCAFPEEESYQCSDHHNASRYNQYKGSAANMK